MLRVRSCARADRAEFSNLQDGSPDDAARLMVVHAYLDAAYGDSDGDLTIEEWLGGMMRMAQEMDDDTFEAEISKWTRALASNQRAMWRDVHAKGHAHELVTAARASGATHVLLVQPAAHHALPTDTDATDADDSDDDENSSEWAPPAPLPAQVVLGRPSSGGALAPLSPSKRINRPASAYPGYGLAASKSTPALSPPPKAAAAPDSPERAHSPSHGRPGALTHRGTAQCMAVRRGWFARMPIRPMLLTSPARCARETALHVAGRLDEASALADESSPAGRRGGRAARTLHMDGVTPEKAPPLCVCETLSPAAPPAACAELVRQKAQQREPGADAIAPPLRTLLNADGGEAAFGNYAANACAEIAAELRRVTPPPGAKRPKETYVSIFGHAGYVHAIGHAIAAASGMEASHLDAMIDLDLRDVDGLLVPLYGAGKTAIHLKRPK
jgi:hypothetical protein